MDEENKSAFIIAFLMTSFSGFLIGLLVGWAIWG